MTGDYLEQFGMPDLQISGLRLWIHGRQFPDSDDYWDGNWLNITAHCQASGANVTAGGSILHLSELHGWLKSLEKMNATLQGSASLECMEPELGVAIKAGNLGHIEMEVNITPSHLEQQHRFIFEIDQTYLPDLIEQCSSVLATFPLKDQ